MICTRSTLDRLWLGLTLISSHEDRICGLWLERISQVALCKLLQTEAGLGACRRNPDLARHSAVWEGGSSCGPDGT